MDEERLAANAEQLERALRPKVRAAMPVVRAELEQLARIPSMSAPGFDPARVRESALVTASMLRGAGADTRIVERPGAHPAVVGRVQGPTGSPTVLLYAHHDVQPPGARDRWRSDPFVPTERDGRLYGRGVKDDKSGVAAHTMALRAWGGSPPVNVALFVEGEEESGSTHLGEFLASERASLDAEVVIIADSTNWRLGRPAITTSMRGTVMCNVEVRVADHAAHSGSFGGVIPDAHMVMSRLLASLHDDKGSVAVEGLLSMDADPLDLTEADVRGLVGARPSVQLIGTGSLTSRLWRQPAISIIGLDATSVAEASGTIWPTTRARISLRVPPGLAASVARDALVRHLENHVPWGAEVTVTADWIGEPFTTVTGGAVHRAFSQALTVAWGIPSIDIGHGGSIPFLFDFARLFPRATLLISGTGGPESMAHAENESLHLGDFENACVAEAVFLGLMASVRPAA